MIQGDLLADPNQALDDTTIATAVGEVFGFHGTVRDHFDSERDQTALLVDDVGAQRVVKVSHAATRVSDVDLEGRAAVWVREVDQTLPMAVPVPTPTRNPHGRLQNQLS